MYLTLKIIHALTVVISIGGFAIRGWLKIRDTEKTRSILQAKWLRILPHANDTLLLVSAIWLAVLLSLSPLEQPWLLTKIIALLLYIGLGMVLMKKALSKTTQIAFYLAALATACYIVMVAVSKSPLPGLSI